MIRVVWFLILNKNLEQRNKTNIFINMFEEWKRIFEGRNFKVIKLSSYKMMLLHGKSSKFKFHFWVKSLQNIIKKLHIIILIEK